MPHYKDAINKLHFLDDENDDDLLPTGCTLITQAEADAINAPPKTAEEKKEEDNQVVKIKIEAMEGKSLRAMREAILTNNKEALLLIEADIVTERAKLK